MALFVDDKVFCRIGSRMYMISQCDDVSWTRRPKRQVWPFCHFRLGIFVINFLHFSYFFCEPLSLFNHSPFNNRLSYSIQHQIIVNHVLLTNYPRQERTIR